MLPKFTRRFRKIIVKKEKDSTEEQRDLYRRECRDTDKLEAKRNLKEIKQQQNSNYDRNELIKWKDVDMIKLNILSASTFIPPMIFLMSKYLDVRSLSLLHVINKERNKNIPKIVRIQIEQYHDYGEYSDYNHPLVDKNNNKALIINEDEKLLGINIEMIWKDQGWGNLKGKIVIHLYRNNDKNEKELISECIPFPIADHKWRPEYIDINNNNDNGIITKSQSNDWIEFFGYVGSGGGHQLFLEDFQACFILKKKQFSHP